MAKQPEMTITIAPFDRASNTVTATFAYAGATHTRAVNAVLDARGRYDREATEDRVAEVARGVERKIELGAITNPPELPQPDPAVSAAQAPEPTA